MIYIILNNTEFTSSEQWVKFSAKWIVCRQTRVVVWNFLGVDAVKTELVLRNIHV